MTVLIVCVTLTLAACLIYAGGVEIERRAEYYARKLSAAPMTNASDHEIKNWNEAWIAYEHYWDCACSILRHYRAMIEGKKDDKSE